MTTTTTTTSQTAPLLQVAKDKWVNPNYIVAAVLHDDHSGKKPERTLTLTLDGSTGVADQYPDITGDWVGYVMHALNLNQDTPNVRRRA